MSSSVNNNNNNNQNNNKEQTLSVLKIKPRKSNERGHAQMSWLNSYHTFSFANYYDPEFEDFYSLRVINEDRVKPSQGFGTHGHREYEIFSYVVNGALRHRDSMNNDEIIKRGDVQFTTAGTGIRHSEYNASDKELVHFLQIWVKPTDPFLQPSYQTAHFTDQDKQGKLCLIVSPDGENKSAVIHQKLKVWASILKNGEKVSLPVNKDCEYYVQLVQDINGFDKEHNATGLHVKLQGHDDKKPHKLGGGDGVFLVQRLDAILDNLNESIVFEGANSSDESQAEFLVFEVDKKS